MPPKALFDSSHRPDKLVMPACEECNRGTSTAHSAGAHHVLAGILKVTNIDTGQIDIYKPGRFFLESVGQWHIASNIGGESPMLLVVDFVEEGQSNIVPLK